MLAANVVESAAAFLSDVARFRNDVATSALTLVNAVQSSPTNTSSPASQANPWNKIERELTADWSQTQQAAVHFAFAVMEAVHQEFTTLIRDADTLLDEWSIRLRGQPLSTSPIAGNIRASASADAHPSPILAVSPPPAVVRSRTSAKPLLSPPPPPPLPVVTFFEESNAMVNEGQPAVIAATLSAAQNSTVSVQFTTSDGTATAGKDYAATSGALTFTPGETMVTSTVPTFDDKAVNEPNETVTVTLSDPSGATLGDPSSGVFTIVEETGSSTNLPPEAVPGDNNCNCGCPNQSGSLAQKAANLWRWTTTIIPDRPNGLQHYPALPDDSTNNPVRYADGVVTIAQTDLHSDGFGFPWGQTRSWTNGPGYATGSDNGSGWVDTYTPHLIQADGSTDNTLIYIANGNTAYYYDLVNGSYQPRINDGSKLTYNSSNDTYTLIDTLGDQIVFDGFGTSWLSA